jgi:FkbM family methyltransferase
MFQIAVRISRLTRRFARSFADSYGVCGRWAVFRCLKAWVLTRLGLPSTSLEVNLQFKELRAIVDVSRNEIFSYWEIWYEAAYEALEQFSGKGDTCIVDVGANVGFYSMRRSLFQRDCRIYSFEPSPSSFSRLERNIKSNGLCNVEVFNWAIGSHSGFVRFDDAPQSIQSRVSVNGKIEVMCKALDDVVYELGIRQIDILKINTEGHERFILEGAKATLPKVSRVVLEVHGDIGERSSVEEALQEAGLHVLLEKNRLVYYGRQLEA